MTTPGRASALRCRCGGRSARPGLAGFVAAARLRRRSCGGFDADRVAEGQAYLNGFVIKMLAEAMHVPVPEALDRIRRLLGGGGDETGNREPRRPAPSPPALAAELDLRDE